jgi:hypothetical protein
VVLRMMDRLLPSIGARLSNGIPSILNLYRTSMMSSDVMRSTTISDPYVVVSTVFWRLDTHLMGVQLINRRIPVTDCRVNLSVA